jgi:hypothetical protein
MIVSVKRSTGSTVGAGLKQVPSYAAAVSGPAQLQALDSSELRQVEGLNLQGVIKAIYLRGNLAGVVRPNGTGGDLVIIGMQTWLVVKVLETWPLWTKAVVVLQVGS